MNVTLQKQGKHWRAVWLDRDAKRRTKTLGLVVEVSRRQAEGRVRDIVQQFSRDSTLVNRPERTTLDEWFTTWRALRKPHVSAGTMGTYDFTLDRLRDRLGRGRLLRSITVGESDAWVSSMLSDGLREVTVCGHLSRARSVFNMAVQHELVPTNVFARVAMPVVEVSDLWVPPDADVYCLIDNAEPPMRCLLALCALAGLRRSEAMALRWDHVAYAENKITVYNIKTGRATGRPLRAVLLDPKLAAILHEAEDAELPWPCFGVSLDRGALHRAAVAEMERAGVTPWPKPYHRLRSWRATSWRKHYPEHVVDAWLGHGAEVARRHYAAVDASWYGAGVHVDGVGGLV